MDTLTPQPVTAPTFSIKRVFIVSLVTSLILSALVAIGVFLLGTFGETEVRLLLTTLAIGGYSLTGLCSSVLYDKKRYTTFALFGLAVAAISFLLTTGMIWGVLTYEEGWQAVIIGLILSFSTAHASLLVLAMRGDRTDLAVMITLGCIAIVAGMLISLVSGNYDVGELYYRLLGVVAVLDVLGTIIVPILRRARRASVPAQ